MFSKQCSRCGQNKGITYFIRKDGKGNHSLCKECRNAVFYNKSPFEK
jgi:hypothetical protein